jgi:hypothetical protein
MELPAIAAIDERFQSFNIEMVEVTGGAFWKPYAPQKQRSVANGKNDLFENRSPIDLSNKLLRKLTSALSPALMRVSGTWANTTFFAGSDGRPTRPPAGYKGVLTGDRWREVIDFSNAVDAPIVTSFAVSAGARRANGIWKSDLAQQMISAARRTEELSRPS